MKLITFIATTLSSFTTSNTLTTKSTAQSPLQPQRFHLADGSEVEILMAGTFQDGIIITSDHDGMTFHPTPEQERDDCHEHSYMAYPDAIPAPRQDCESARHMWKDCVDCHGYWFIEGSVAMPEEGRFYELFSLANCTLGIKSDRGHSESWYIGDQDVVEALDDALDIVDRSGAVAATGTMFCHDERSGSPLAVSWVVYRT